MLELRKVIHHSKQNKESNKIDENLFVQKESKKRLSLKVNGEAIVIMGTILRLRCPRRKTDKESDNMLWFKNSQRIAFNKRVKMTAKNVLRIKSVDISDSGVYSCSWDNKTYHTINLQIRHLSESNEDKTVERPHFPPKIGLNSYDFGKVIIESEERSDKSHGISENKDTIEVKQTFTRIKPKRANRHPIHVSKESDLKDFSAESPINNNEQRMDTFEVNYDHNKEFSDQNIAKDKPLDRKDVGDSSEEKFRGERRKDDSVSELRKLLTKEIKSKLYKMEDFPNDSEFKANKNNKTKELIKQIKGEHFLTDSLVSINDKTNDLKFNWMTTEWSVCTVVCGGTGYQVILNCVP